MKRIIIIFILGFSISYSFSQIDTIKINGHDFIFKTISKTNSDIFEETYLYLYRLDKDGKAKYLLKHSLDLTMGNSNSMSVEMGDFSISDSTITFYSFWCWQGDAPVSPWGARIQVYTVRDSGLINKGNSRLYIETSRQGWHENKGIEYLYKGANSKIEKDALKEYIRNVEDEYNADFVFGKESDRLLIEVKDRLKDRINILIKDWETIENSFGFKI